MEKINKTIHNRKNKIIFVLLLLGFIYRLFLSRYAETYLFWDMKIYHNYADDILSGVLVSDCCLKNLGYSAFLAFIYIILGTSTVFGISLIQTLLDCLVALMVYYIARKHFSPKAAFLSFLIYIFNPFTATYVGLRLPEILSLFYLSLFAFLLSQRSFIQNKLLWLLSGVIFGLLVFTRMQYYLFFYILVFGLTLLIFKKFNRILFVIIFSLGFLVASSYSLISNYTNFKVISFSAPYVNRYGTYYGNFYSDIAYPEIFIDRFPVLNPEFRYMAEEYYMTDVEDKQLYEEKYRRLFFEKLKKDWPLFIKNSFRNLFRIWDKNHLYLYTDVFYPYDMIPLRVLNIFLLFFFFWGVIKYIKTEKKNAFRNPLFVLTLLLFLYISSAFPIVSTEGRHTIAFYSLISLWAGYGIYQILKSLEIKI